MERKTKHGVILDVEDGRIIIEQIEPPVGEQTRCLEIHRSTGGNSWDVRFIMLTEDEFEHLRSIFASVE